MQMQVSRSPRIKCQECGAPVSAGERHEWPECIERHFFGPDALPEDGDPEQRNIRLTGAIRILLDYIKEHKAQPHTK